MMIIICICTAVFIISLILTRDLTLKSCQKESDEKMAKCCEKYDREISQLYDKYRKLDAQHENLQSDYERSLKNNYDYEKRFRKILIEKADIQYQATKFQKELYAARKRIKEILGSNKK